MNWEWSDIYSHPLWMVSTAILAIILRAQRKVPWNPRACPAELKRKTAIITGANTGIGKFIALDFARRGARVILACRSEARGTAALQEIRDRSGNQNVHLRLLDTSSLESVRKFAARILEEEKELHILVNNAGASGLPSKITADGLEITFATNHIGPFLLTSLLLDLLKKSAPARIVNVSSVNHWKGEVDFSHFRGDNLSNVMDTSYNHTKLHNVIWTNELARRLQGTGVTANSVHPGVVLTDVMRNYNFIIRFLFNLVGFFFFKPRKQCLLYMSTTQITLFQSQLQLQCLRAAQSRSCSRAVNEDHRLALCKFVTKKLLKRGLSAQFTVPFQRKQMESLENTLTVTVPWSFQLLLLEILLLE